MWQPYTYSCTPGTILLDACRLDASRALWRTVNSILNAPAQQSTATFTANDFAQFFQSKVNKIRDSTALHAHPQTFNTAQCLH